MAVSSLKLEGFTAFEHLELDFSPGVNVIIGENGTGKSHVLKALYVLLSSFKTSPRTSIEIGGKHYDRWFDLDGSKIFDRFVGTFMSDETGDLIRGGSGEFRCVVQAGEFSASAQFNEEGTGWLTGGCPEPGRVVLLPPHEVLSFATGFVSLYDAREISFDLSYRDLIQLLEKPVLRKKDSHAHSAAIRQEIGGEFVHDEGRFYLVSGDVKRRATLEAEGIRKLGVLQRLMDVGALTKGTLLLWDEPEANLNPKLVRLVCESLMEISRRGVQVVVATHGYLFARTLSLISEYANEKSDMIRFFSLFKQLPGGPVSAESGRTLAEISHDALLDAFTDYHDRSAQMAAAQFGDKPLRRKKAK